MAGMESIDAAGRALEDSVLEVTQLLAAFKEMAYAVGGADARWPAWFSLLDHRCSDVDEKLQVYMGAVHQHARPILNDMARAKAGNLG